jgi:hypothetical protein
MGILLFYDQAKGKGAIGTLDANAFTTTMELPAGSFSQWTHVVASGPTVLFYNQANGAVAFGTLTPTAFTTDREFQPGSFGTWTNIVPTAAGWLFYDGYTGAAALGEYRSVGVLKEFVTTASLPRESLSEWTHIVADGDTVLFYNRLNASAAIGNVTASGLTTTQSYAPGTFGVWTHIVNDGATVFFYNRDNGSAAVGTLTPTTLTTNTTFQGGAFSAWTHISANGPALLFYNQETGSGAIGNLTANSFSTTKSFGSGSFGNWSHITGDSSCGPESQQIKFAVLLCHWHRAPGLATVLPPDFYREYMFDMGAPDGIGRFWFDQSGGRLRFTGQVHDWIPLSKDPNDSSIVNNRQALAVQAMADAQAAGWQPGNEQAIVVVVATLGSKGVNAGAILNPVNVAGMNRWVAVLHGDSANWIESSSGNVLGSDYRFDFNSHEVGHVVGDLNSFDHAFGPNGVYDHPYCIMAAMTYGGVSAIFDVWQQGSSRPPEVQTKGPGLDGATRAACGWARIRRFTPQDLQQGVEVRIAHLGDHDTGLPQVVEFSTQANGAAATYTLEFRSGLAFWDQAFEPAMVLCQREGSIWSGNPTWGPRSSTYVNRAIVPADGGPLPTLSQSGVVSAEVLEMGGEWIRVRLTEG